jgi:putative ATP-dependent endonuclease of the OLD family
MRLKEVYLKNFRSYNSEIRIPITDLTAFIGQNDIGKSTVLEALEIFFNNETVQIDSADACAGSPSKEVEIGCVFEGFPEEIVIDSSAKTKLVDEFLLNQDGFLEIRKSFNCALKTPKEKVGVWAFHPSVEGGDDLLGQKIGELKKRAEKLKISDADFGVKASLRKAIWKRLGALELSPTLVAVDSEDAADIWKKLQESLPTFALFKSDRTSMDDDDEVQDPMKLAVKQALKALEPDLKRIKETVHREVLQVATRTLEKLHEMDSTLAKQLNPNFRAEPKWDGIFNLSLTGDGEIPINKRGSGVRRLILLSFFRAEAERRRLEKNAPDVIYAIEEPETSQHPNNQKMLASALLDLSKRENCQVLVTTHVPGFAGLLPTDTLRCIRARGTNPRVITPNDEELEALATDLGVFPDHKVKLLLFVEGPNDIVFLKHLSHKLHASDPSHINFFADPRVAFVPMGGSSLREWVDKQFLKAFNRPEFHLYDSDDPANPKYKPHCDAVNARGDGSFAMLTARREVENYIPKAGIERILEIELPAYDALTADVPELVAKAIHEKDSETPWEQLSEEKKSKKISSAKRRLNHDVMEKVTLTEFRAEDADADVSGWIKKVSEAVR